jgi:hypothetical protein
VRFPTLDSRREARMRRCRDLWGDVRGREGYVVAGSDSGLVFVFDVATGISLALLPASEQITNAVQPHTFLPVLATSGIRHRIHIWEQNPAPTSAIPSALTPQYCKSDGGRTADRLRACPSPWLRRCPGGTVEKRP